MPNAEHFAELRRMAFARGESDYYRAKEQAEPGAALFKNNPHQNNHATDEREEWERGWHFAEAEDNGFEPNTALIPEAEGDVVMMVCQRIGGKLHFVQRRFTRHEIEAAEGFHAASHELSKMLAQLNRQRTSMNRA